MDQIALAEPSSLPSPKPEPERLWEQDGSLVDPARYVNHRDDGLAHLYLIIENLECAACVQRIERSLNKLDAIHNARVNLSTKRMSLVWDDNILSPLDAIKRIKALGFIAKPFDPRLGSSLSEQEDRALLRALGVAGFAAANVMLVSVGVWAGLVADMGPATRGFFHWVSALIVLPAIAYAGRPFFRSALAALKAGSLNMDVPISLAVLLAGGMSLSETIAGAPHVYFDAAAMLLFFLLIGRYLDRRARTQARSAAQNLLSLRTAAATIIDEEGQHRLIPIEEVAPGMHVFAPAGGRFPVDGVIANGTTDIDTSMVTGESLPQACTEGSEVFAGTLNLTAPVVVRVTAADEGTLLSEIVRLMEAAEQGRAKYIRLADRAAQIYAPAVHGLAALTFLGWWLFTSLGWQDSLFTAIAVLIITCPCALGLAVPAVQVVAVGRLLKKGILVKVSDGLERLAHIDTVIFDKTGTLTTGDLEWVNGDDVREEDLNLAASIAITSKHPLSRALVREAGTVTALSNVQEVPGAGLSAQLPDGRKARLGSRKWCGLEETGATSEKPYSEIWFAIEQEPPIPFFFRDRQRPDAARVIDYFQKRHIHVELLSGDREAVVAPFAKNLGLSHWQAEARPQDKIARLDTLRQKGRQVLMVGDGLNDAPALAAASVSLSPSSASDLTQAAADFVFQGEKLGATIELFEVAKKSRLLILQNFALALGYNMIAIPLAMAGLVTPLIAAFAMSASSLIVTGNAMRLRRGSKRLTEQKAMIGERQMA